MENALPAHLQQMLIDQIKHQNDQDLPGVLRLIHKESFSYGQTQQLLMKVFASYQLRCSLLEQKLIDLDGDFAFMRVKMRNEKLEGPEFRNNVTDSIVVFRRLNDEWKIWCQSPIDFQAS